MLVSTCVGHTAAMMVMARAPTDELQAHEYDSWKCVPAALKRFMDYMDV